ncbi:MAG: shikimate dehydrogenase [Candidatus Dormibacteraeota bacterium]|nr:shikimate dehydrogenase [Candidatus Dormibacteraeota bacterium]
MQSAALRAAGLEGTYERHEVSAAELPEFMEEMRRGAFQGCNVTIPHKRLAAELCDRLEGDAAILRVTNTVSVDGMRLIGSNTDAAGFALSLRRAGLAPGPGAKAVILGAGGGAAAVALAMARLQVGRLTVVARHLEAALAIARDAAPDVPSIAVEWNRNDARRPLAEADLVVNASPVGLHSLPVDVHSLQPSCTVADVRYRPRPVDLVATAAGAGLRALDGVGMLLCQGMLSFRRWTGLEPPWEVAEAALLDALRA